MNTKSLAPTLASFVPAPGDINPWPAIDLISTHEGMRKRYGFIYVNRDEFDMLDLGRYRKDSFFWYQQVSATNGENLADIV